MNNQTILKYAACIAWQIERTEGFVYINNIKTGDFIYFENVSKDIWLAIDGKNSMSDIVSKIASMYGVEESLVTDDVFEFAAGLCSNGVVVENE